MTAVPTLGALIVAGMHRSGTSAMARMLSLAGGALPQRVIGAGPDNPLGFWEPMEMVSLNDEILSEIDMAWDDPFIHRANAKAWDARHAFTAKAAAFVDLNYGGHDLPVIKDPRTSVVSALWSDVFEAAGYAPVYIIMVRNPVEVAGSLAARNGMPLEAGLMSWMGHMLAVERDTRGRARLFVTYDDLLSDWRGVLDRVEAQLGRALPRRDAASTEIDAFLSPAHRHHRANVDNLAEASVWPAVEAAYAWMIAAARDQAPKHAVLTALETEMDDMARLMDPVLRAARGAAQDALLKVRADLADRERRLIRERARFAELQDAEAQARARLQQNHEAALAAIAADRSRETDDAETERTLAVTEIGTLREQVEALQVTTDAITAERDAALAARDDTLGDLTRRSEDLQRQQLAHVALEDDVRHLTEQLAQAGHAAVSREHALGQAADDARSQRAEIMRLEGRIETMTNSESWRLTRPLRVVRKRLNKR